MTVVEEVRPLAAPTAGPSLDLLGEQHDDVRSAVVLPGGRVLDRGQLRTRVIAAAAHLPDAADGRRLVHVPLSRDLDAVVAHLAVLAAGHVGLVTAPDAPQDLLDRCSPDVRATGEGAIPFEVDRGGPRHLLHDDLALLLPTSGSTGSPKLVRLSREGVLSNARAIAASLGLREGDVALTTLPLHYCFGLSVLHSQLVCGGGIALTDASVTDPAAWDLARTADVSVVPAVPHTLRLLEHTDHLDTLPSLRLVTQAGGGLPAEEVRAWSRRGRAAGWGLAVMYGQTEATARIAVHRPEEVAAAPGLVGRPVPGTTVRLDGSVDGAAELSARAGRPVGELVVEGPGVMLGYAHEPADLALGRMVPELRTGDLASVTPDGRLRIHGRRSGFAKIMGLRIDLAAVESRLRAAGLETCVTSDDAVLRVTTTSGPDRAARVAASAAGLAPANVSVALVDELPRLPSGKVDRMAAAAAHDRPPARGRRTRHAGREGAVPAAERVAAVVEGALGRPVDLELSFAAQGGDSFTLVPVSLGLTDVLGPLPRGWQHRPLRELLERPAPTGSARWSTVETSMVLRALAVLTICATHATVVDVPGGAHTLLAIAGANLAGLTLSAPSVGELLARTARSVRAIAIPSMLVALLVHLATGAYGWENVLLLNWAIGTVEWGPRIELWFVEAMLACTVAVAGAVALVRALPDLVPTRWRDPVRSAVGLAARHRWALALGCTAIALVPRFALVPDGTGPTRGTPPTVLWLVLAGVTLGLARRRRESLITLAVVAAGGATFFPDPQRNATVLAGIALLGLVPHVRVPRALVPALGALAAASLHIYLVQFHVLGRVGHSWTGVVASLAGGLAYWALARAVSTAWRTARVPSPSPTPTTT